MVLRLGLLLPAALLVTVTSPPGHAPCGQPRRALAARCDDHLGDGRPRWDALPCEGRRGAGGRLRPSRGARDDVVGRRMSWHSTYWISWNGRPSAYLPGLTSASRVTLLCLFWVLFFAARFGIVSLNVAPGDRQPSGAASQSIRLRDGHTSASPPKAFVRPRCLAWTASGAYQALAITSVGSGSRSLPSAARPSLRRSTCADYGSNPRLSPVVRSGGSGHDVATDARGRAAARARSLTLTRRRALPAATSIS